MGATPSKDYIVATDDTDTVLIGRHEAVDYEVSVVMSKMMVHS